MAAPKGAVFVWVGRGGRHHMSARCCCSGLPAGGPSCWFLKFNPFQNWYPVVPQLQSSSCVGCKQQTVLLARGELQLSEDLLN